MANPNTKIIIQEHDASVPRGAGVSSDVAYIPGLARTYVETKTGPVEFLKTDLIAAGISEAELTDGSAGYVYQGLKNGTDHYYYKKTPRNVPVLCYTVDEFVSYFGEVPYQFTAEDVVEGTYSHTCQEGGYDRSYIYAKELLQSGLTIYYENISPEETSPVNIATVTLSTADTAADHIESLGGNKFVYYACVDTKGTTHQYGFEFKLPSTLATKDGASEGIGATIIVDTPDVEDLTTQVTNFEAVDASGNTVAAFTCTSAPKSDAGDSYNVLTISWAKGVPAETFTSTTFNFIIQYTYDGDLIGVDCNTTIAVLETDTIATKADAETISTVSFGKIQYLYSKLADAFTVLEDKNEYTVKYITSGGYPTFDVGPEIYTTMLSVAGTRGDAVALIDHLDTPAALHGVNENTSIFSKVNNSSLKSDANASYGAMFTPWGKYSFATVTDNADAPAYMPGSYGYMMCLAAAIKTSPNWLAMAGVTRGRVPNLVSLHLDKYLSNVVAEDYQPKFGTGKNVSINCITNIKPYGLCIWGNRTLLPVDPKGTKATNGLNTRNMTSDIKKVAYDTAKKLMFEQDSEILWTRFKAGVSGLLDQLKSGYGISDYKVIRTATKYKGEALTRGELAATIKIFPISAIEYFEITVVLADEDVQVS